MKIYPVTNNLLDVFIGDGWENWSRWYWKNNTLKQVSGKENQFVKARLVKHLKGEVNG